MNNLFTLFIAALLSFPLPVYVMYKSFNAEGEQAKMTDLANPPKCSSCDRVLSQREETNMQRSTDVYICDMCTENVREQTARPSEVQE